MMKLVTVLKIVAAILLVVVTLSRFNTARADDPAYYKLEDVKELTIYKDSGIITFQFSYFMLFVASLDFRFPFCCGSRRAMFLRLKKFPTPNLVVYNR
jgi:hypothetical protein